MKYLLLVVSFGFFQTSFAQIEERATTPEKLAHMIFSSFQSNNYSAFLKNIFTDSDCDLMAKNAEAPDSLKIIVVEQMKGLANYVRQTSKENFETILSTVEQKGIVWKKVMLTDVKFEIKTRDNIQSTDIFLYCKYKKINFRIKLDNCHKSDAWLMMDSVEIQFIN